MEAYLNAKGGEDWRFCLAASQLLVEIVKNNVTKGSTAEIQSWGAYDLSKLISQFAKASMASVLSIWELFVAKLTLLLKDEKFGQKQLSVRQEWLFLSVSSLKL